METANGKWYFYNLCFTRVLSFKTSPCEDGYQPEDEEVYIYDTVCGTVFIPDKDSIGKYLRKLIKDQG